VIFVKRNAPKFKATFVFSSLTCSEIWLISVVEDCWSGIYYITKLMKNNPAGAEGGKMNCYANMI
jgi:hypothetical protein